VISECLLIDTVDDSKVVHRLEEYCGLHDFSQITPGSFDDGAEVLEHLFRLFLDAAGHDLSSRRIKWDAPRDEQEVSEFDSLRIWSNSAWGVGGEDGGQGWVGRNCGRHCSLEG